AIAHWRSKVASHPSSSSEYPIAPIVASPRTRRPPVTLVRPGEAVHFGRPYRTSPNRPRRLLTARKKVGPHLARRLAWRCVSPRSSNHHSSSSSLSSETSTTTLIISSAAPVVGTTLVTSPTRLCGLVPYSDSDSNSPVEMDSPEYVTPLSATSLFVCIDSSADSDSSDAPHPRIHI
nr:hypothetical protein [Tanacetum cinerariifolium]